MKKHVFFVAAILCFVLNSEAQSGKVLNIGDTVPDMVFNQLLNYKDSLRLYELKGKVVILDFWSTHCIPCIEALPKYDSLQKKFGDRLKVLLVTYEKPEVIRDFWKNNPYTKTLSLTSVMATLALHKMFEVTVLPQVIWLDADMVIRAYTGIDYISSEKINQVLSGETKSWLVNKYLGDYDYSQPLMRPAAVGANTPKVVSYSGVTSFIPGIQGYPMMKKDSLAGVWRWHLLNGTIPILYKNLLSQLNRGLPTARTYLEVKDSSRYIRPAGKNLTDWNTENSFCYDGTAPLTEDTAALLKRMFSDLNACFNLDGRVEKRMVDCYVLKISDRKTFLAAIQNGRPGEVKTTAEGILSWQGFQKVVPFVDETGFTGTLPIEYVTDLNALHKMLAAKGLGLISAKRRLDMLVISERD